MSEDKIKKIDEQMAKLKAQKQAIIQREKIKERKARTRRLIEIGAIIEKYLGVDTPAKAETLGKILTANPEKLAELKNRLEKASHEI